MPCHAAAAAGSRACGDGHTAYAAAKRATPGTELSLVLLSADGAEVAAAAGIPGGIAEGARPDLFARLRERPALRLTLATVAALPDSAGRAPDVFRAADGVGRRGAGGAGADAAAALHRQG